MSVLLDLRKLQNYVLLLGKVGHNDHQVAVHCLKQISTVPGVHFERNREVMYNVSRPMQGLSQEIVIRNTRNGPPLWSSGQSS
jgi:hypothetical protein